MILTHITAVLKVEDGKNIAQDRRFLPNQLLCGVLCHNWTSITTLPHESII